MFEAVGRVTLCFSAPAARVARSSVADSEGKGMYTLALIGSTLLAEIETERHVATTVLLTPEQIDEAAKKTVSYRSPGA